MNHIKDLALITKGFLEDCLTLTKEKGLKSSKLETALGIVKHEFKSLQPFPDDLELHLIRLLKAVECLILMQPHEKKVELLKVAYLIKVAYYEYQQKKEKTNVRKRNERNSLR